mmetsp:Transcript_25191/g.63212  ORF Transcript_25191/g.63212 Transcript_25191/m.63212 type:complete len:141 (+) Transcript_25191:2076-2498(+)
MLLQLSPTLRYIREKVKKLSQCKEDYRQFRFPIEISNRVGVSMFEVVLFPSSCFFPFKPPKSYCFLFSVLIHLFLSSIPLLAILLLSGLYCAAFRTSLLLPFCLFLPLFLLVSLFVVVLCNDNVHEWLEGRKENRNVDRG